MEEEQTLYAFLFGNLSERVLREGKEDVLEVHFDFLFENRL